MALDRILADKLALKLEAAEAELRHQMEARGLRRTDGWTIIQFTREAHGGTLLVLRPMHLRITPPGDLECVVGVTAGGSDIEADCGGGHSI
jgi:hypothetical protein